MCAYPIEGKYYHHPEEARLKIKCILNLLGCVFSAAASVDQILETVVLGRECHSHSYESSQRDNGREKKVVVAVDTGIDGGKSLEQTGTTRSKASMRGAMWVRY